MKYLLILTTLLIMTTELEAKKKDKDRFVEIKTSKGDIVVKLYKDAPLHANNFYNLAQEGFFDSLLFHRVIKNFMIQGGDPQSKNAAPGQMLGNGEHGNRIPAEFNANLIHKKGALAMARDNNPEKASSGCQFYIVQGKPVNDNELNQFENRNGIKYTDEQRKIYKTIGGTPFLDNNYTVFGEVVSGMEVIDVIASVQTGNMDRPVENVMMSMKILKKFKSKK